MRSTFADQQMCIDTQDPQGFMGSPELKQKDSCSSERFVPIYQPKWHHILEKGNLQILRTYLKEERLLLKI